MKKPDGAGYTYPPLWGADTYNDGAGMHRVITAAEFIKKQYALFAGHLGQILNSRMKKRFM